MKPGTASNRIVWHVGLGFLLACLLFAVAALVVKNSVAVPAIDANRVAVRLKALAKIRAKAKEDLYHVGWVDKQRGIVRLPIHLAMKIAAQEWKHPAAARSNLIAREALATKPLPKPAAPSNPFD